MSSDLMAALAKSLRQAPRITRSERRFHGLKLPIRGGMGENDDWTPGSPCHDRASRFPDEITWLRYPGAYHGFDVPRSGAATAAGGNARVGTDEPARDKVARASRTSVRSSGHWAARAVALAGLDFFSPVSCMYDSGHWFLPQVATSDRPSPMKAVSVHWRRRRIPGTATGMRERVVMTIAVAVIALFVFVALLMLDTGVILGLAFSWALGGPAYRWILLSALLAIVTLYVCRRKGPRFSVRARATRSPRQPRASRPQKSNQQARRQKPIATLGKC